MRLTSKPGACVAWVPGLFMACWLAQVTAVAAADVEAGRKLFRTGNYTECIHAAEQAIADSARDEEWAQLLARAQLAVGRYADAQAAVELALDRHRYSARVRLLASAVRRRCSRS